MLHGIVPGPFILKEHPDVFWGVITSMYIGNFILLILNIPAIRLFVKIIEIPYALLSPLIVFICSIGAFSINNNPWDIVIMVIFGILGYLMRKFGYEPAPFMLAYVLGPMLEKSLRQTLIISQGSLSIFITRPIAAGLVGGITLIILWSLLAAFLKSGPVISVLNKIKYSTDKGD